MAAAPVSAQKWKEERFLEVSGFEVKFNLRFESQIQGVNSIESQQTFQQICVPHYYRNSVENSVEKSVEIQLN